MRAQLDDWSHERSSFDAESLCSQQTKSLIGGSYVSQDERKSVLISFSASRAQRTRGTTLNTQGSLIEGSTPWSPTKERIEQAWACRQPQPGGTELSPVGRASASALARVNPAAGRERWYGRLAGLCWIRTSARMTRFASPYYKAKPAASTQPLHPARAAQRPSKSVASCIAANKIKRKEGGAPELIAARKGRCKSPRRHDTTEPGA